MKRIIALLLALLLFASVSAFAEEGLYIRQLPQYKYVLDFVLTPESYPEVCLSPYSSYKFFTAYNPAEPVFLCFPGPAGAMVCSFDTSFVSYLDTENAIQYHYELMESDSYEEFVNKAPQDEYVLMDGSDGIAAYIDPESLRARAMIGTKEFGKSSKLVFSIILDNMDTRMSLEKRVQALTDAIEAEINRVRSAMHIETKAPFWSEGRYAGVKLLDPYDYSYMLKFTFPTLSCTFEDGVKEALPMVISLRFNELKAVYNYGDGRYATIGIKLDDNPFPIYKMENQDPDALKVSLSNGSEWNIYMNGLSENGKTSYTYASKALGHKNKYDKEYYLTVQMDLDKMSWSSMEEYLEDVALFDNSYEILNADDDPYIPAESEAEGGEGIGTALTPISQESTKSEPAADSSWICPNCESENTGKFCGNCGTAKPQPESDEWTCPNCETVNSGKFCTECGTAKPAQ